MTRAAGIGCATASQSRGLAADCKGKPQGNPFERRTSALGSAFNLRQIDPRAGSAGDREPCRRSFGSKKVRLNFLSSPRHLQPRLQRLGAMDSPDLGGHSQKPRPCIERAGYAFLAIGRTSFIGFLTRFLCSAAVFLTKPWKNTGLSSLKTWRARSRTSHRRRPAAIHCCVMPRARL